jgi:hypothetical protein
MSRYLPIILGVIAIVGLTIPQIQMSDRFAGSNYSAEQKADLLKKIPMRIGDWQAEEMEIDPQVREIAGAVGAVSRVYRNSRTGDKVDLWLIVGHGRVISAHTPNICYQASGFEMRAAENSLFPMVISGQREAPFWTNTFFKEDSTGRRLIRVFWSWYNTENEDSHGQVVWEAPDNARWYFGNTRALYKMYFTSQMKDPLETAEQSACLRFAKEFMPVVNEALADVHSENPASSEVVPQTGQTGDVAATPPAETPSEATTAAGDAPVESVDLFGEESTAADQPAENSAAPAVSQ